MRKSERPAHPLHLHLERAARLLSNLQNQVSIVVVTGSRCPRFLLEVANRLHQIRQVGERRRQRHQCLAFSAVAGESRCLQSLPEAVNRLRQILPMGECQRRHLQSLAFFAVVEAARHPALRLPGVVGAAAQMLRWWKLVNHRHRRPVLRQQLQSDHRDGPAHGSTCNPRDATTPARRQTTHPHVYRAWAATTAWRVRSPCSRLRSNTDDSRCTGRTTARHGPHG